MRPALVLLAACGAAVPTFPATAQETTRVSVDSAGVEGDGESSVPAISGDGRFVAFVSAATNLVANDRNGHFDVFVHDRSTGTTERVSVATSGVEANRLTVGGPSISADGRLVAFFSDASNLVAHDFGGFEDIFVHDRTTGVTERMSVRSSGTQANSHSDCPSLSADGRYVAFVSAASNLVAGDTNADTDVFAHELCPTPASWSNYGAGFPGTDGVPTITSRQNSAFDSTVTIDVANSYANPTVGLLFIGFQPASIHSSFGGDLLVAPAFAFFVTFSYGGDTFTGTIPDDRDLCGVAVDLQAIEADPGAAKGVSFTEGLELLVGN